MTAHPNLKGNKPDSNNNSLKEQSTPAAQKKLGIQPQKSEDPQQQ